MSQHTGAGSAHLARVHRHRERVTQARAAALAAAREVAEAGYAATRSAAVSAPPTSPEGQSVTSPPPTAQ